MIGTGLSWWSEKDGRVRWLSRREVARCSREVEGPLCVRDEGDDGKGKEPQEAL